MGPHKVPLMFQRAQNHLFLECQQDVVSTRNRGYQMVDEGPRQVYFRWTRDKGDYNRVLLHSYYTTLTGWRGPPKVYLLTRRECLGVFVVRAWSRPTARRCRWRHRRRPILAH